MKKNSWFIHSFSGLLIFLISGCMKDKITRTYKISTPIYEVLSTFREKIKSLPAVPVETTGKLTVMGKYIFLSEPYKGIHVIDNSNPSNPKNISFINIPGNEDMAIRGNTLYADAYGDLVTFDISDPQNVAAKNFAANVFPDRSIYNFGGMIPGAYINPDSVNVIIGWTTKDTTVDYDPGGGGYPVFYSNCPNCMAAANAMAPAPGAASNNNNVGTNGSTARFSIINDFLYTVGYSTLSTFDISKPLMPSFSGSVQVGWHVETIYPLKDKLFIGTNNGMYMYDVQNSPGTPTLAGSFTHARGCDPVIADDNYAYITLNDSSACLGFNNELQIVDIKDLANSYEVKAYQLSHPIGLSKDGNTLFLCDWKEGLKIYNASDVNNLQLIKQFKNATDYEVVAENGLAIVVANDGLYQYDYADLSNIRLLSKL
jgi:hypothetical protein